MLRYNVTLKSRQKSISTGVIVVHSYPLLQSPIQSAQFAAVPFLLNPLRNLHKFHYLNSKDSEPHISGVWVSQSVHLSVFSEMS